MIRAVWIWRRSSGMNRSECELLNRARTTSLDGIAELWPGKSEQQKTRLAEAIIKGVMEIFPIRRRIGLGGNRRNRDTGLG